MLRRWKDVRIWMEASGVWFPLLSEEGVVVIQHVFFDVEVVSCGSSEGDETVSHIRVRTAASTWLLITN